LGKKGRPRGGKKRLMQLLLGTGLQGANKEAAAKLRQEILNFCAALCDGGEPLFCQEFENRFFGFFLL
jgi:hypothetical protein